MASLPANTAVEYLKTRIKSNEIRNRCIEHMRHHGFLVDNRNIVKFYDLICDDPDTFFQFKPQHQSQTTHKNIISAVAQSLDILSDYFSNARLKLLHTKLHDAGKLTKMKPFPCSTSSPITTASQFDTNTPVHDIKYVEMTNDDDVADDVADDVTDDDDNDDLPTVGITNIDMQNIRNIDTGFHNEIPHNTRNDTTNHIKDIIKCVSQQNDKIHNELRDDIKHKNDTIIMLQTELATTKTQLFLTQRKNPHMATFNRAFESGKDLFLFVLSMQHDVSQQTRENLTGLLERVFDQINTSITENR